MVDYEWHCICTRQKEALDIIDGILDSIIDKMEEKKKPSDIIREQGKEPPEFGKNSNVKAKKKEQGIVKDIEENEQEAELKRIWNAIDEVKSLLSKHTADNPQTSENRPNPSNKEKSDNSERGSGHGNVSNVIKSKTEESPLKRDLKGLVKHFITYYFEKKSSDDYFKHINIKTKREQVFTKKIDELEVKLKLLQKEKSVLIQKVKNLESENSKLKTVVG